jgi:PAS domain S-box-containing protein
VGEFCTQLGRCASERPGDPRHLYLTRVPPGFILPAVDSLRIRLMLLAALALLPLAGLVFYNAEVQRREATVEAEADALRMARVCSSTEQQNVEGANRLLVLMAEIPAVKSLDARACWPLFARVLGNETAYANIGLVDARGVVVASANPMQTNAAMAQQTFFKETVAHDKFSVSAFGFDPGDKHAEMFCGEPVLGENGEVRGVLFAELDLSWMSALPARLAFAPGVSVSVLDRQGLILMRVPDGAQWIGKSAIEAPAGRAIVQARGYGTAHEQSLDHVRRLFAFTELDSVHGLREVVSAGIPDNVAFDAARRSQHRQLFILALFALAAFTTAWFAADILVLRGLRRLLDATHKVTAGDLRTRAGSVPGGGEFRELAQAFDTMAASLEEQGKARDAAERELERRVEERTAELAQANSRLQQQIGSRIATEAELRVTNERLDLALRGANDGIWDWDLTSNRVYFSPRWKEMLGYSINEISDEFREWETRIHPEDRDRSFAAIDDYLGGRIPTFELEHRLRHKEGTYRWILSRAVAVRDGAGKPIRMAGSHADLTERRTAEQALRESKSKIRAFITNVPAILFSIDPDGIITMAEGLGMEVIRFIKGGVVGKSVYELYGDAPPVVDSVRRALAGESFSTTMQSDGLSFEVAYSPIHAENGAVTGTIGVAHDITERVRAKEELERTAAELRRSNDELEQFAYIASHDLQEPLRMVASYTQLLERRYAEKLDEPAREFIAFAVDGARRMQEFISGLLRYSRVGSEPQVLEPVDLHETFLTAYDNLRIAIEESGAAVEYHDLPGVLGDPRQLVQLFQNLIGNAIKFRKPGQAPRVDVWGERESDTFWRISVRDNGIGLDPKFAERVFVIFQRLHTRDEYEGTGLGLAICKKIVERHGGRIRVESREGEGATFSFTLPALPAGAAAQIP